MGTLFHFSDARARWSALVQELWPQLMRYLLSRGLSCADAEDLVADTLESVYRRFDGDCAALVRLPKSYYVTVLRHKQIDRFRSGVGREFASEELFYRTHRNEEELFLRLEREALRLAVQEEIRRLTPEQRQAVDLFYGKGLTLRETAQAMGKSEAAVTSLLDRARKALKKKLKKEVREK